MQKFIEFIPIILFFTAYKLYGILEATITIVISSIITTSIMYIYTKKIDKMSMISIALITILGGMTIITDNSMFIKMKPTVIYSIFVIVLFVDRMRGLKIPKAILKNFPAMKKKGYDIASKHWMLFCIVCAIANEITWRNFEESTWVNFKVFGLLSFNIIFITMQFMVLKKYVINTADK